MSVAPANLTPPRAFLPRVPLRGLSDERLVARVRAGDDAAFEAIFDRHHRPLLAFCRHVLGDHVEAQDVVQHSFVAALAALRADHRPIHLRPWLFAIARNRCLSALRAQRTVVSLDDAEPSVEGLAAEVERRADLLELLADLQRLPVDQREALVLSELGALGHDEIAGVLGVRPGKVKALVFQARENLTGWRDARRADCRDIRAELATARGGALRRAAIRRHLEVCDGCREFHAEVRRQRTAMAAILPVAPGAAMKASVLAAALGGGSVTAGETAAVGGSIAAAVKGLAAKALLASAVAGGTGAAGYVAVEKVEQHRPPAAHAVDAPAGSVSHARDAAPTTSRPPVSSAAVPARSTGTVAVSAPKHSGRHQRHHGAGRHPGKRQRSASPSASHDHATKARGTPAKAEKSRAKAERKAIRKASSPPAKHGAAPKVQRGPKALARGHTKDGGPADAPASGAEEIRHRPLDAVEGLLHHGAAGRG